MKRMLWVLLCLLVTSGVLSACGAAPAVQAQGDLRVSMTTDPSPPLVGKATNLVITVEQAGQSTQNATVAVRCSMPGMEHPEDKDLIPAQADGEGAYGATVPFAMGGGWQVEVVVTPAGGSAQTLTFPIVVEQP